MTVEQAKATTMAAAAAVATGATTVATGAAAAIGVAAAATMMTPTGRRLVVNAHQGDANHREENRDAEQESTIHSKFLQKNSYRENSRGLVAALPTANYAPLGQGG
jgi:hypothetical protein